MNIGGGLINYILNLKINILRSLKYVSLLKVHDAYIELADIHVKTEPLKAVDVYAKYPFNEESTFDDAYLHGEIVRILMKQEQFDDSRLEKHMIAWGRVMGLGVF